MRNNLENATPNTLEELNNSLKSIDNAGSETTMQLNSNYWNLILLYGKLDGSPRSTYAIEVTSKLGHEECATYRYSKFMESPKEIQQDMNDFGYLPDGEYEKMAEYAESLKLHNIWDKSENLDSKLSGCENDVAVYEQKIRDYVQDNPESIASKSKNNFQDSAYSGAWLDMPKQTHQYGRVVLALVNEKLKDDILAISNTEKLGAIKRQMVKDGFLINKEVKDITLSTGNEKKCSLFCIPLESEAE